MLAARCSHDDLITVGSHVAGMHQDERGAGVPLAAATVACAYVKRREPMRCISLSYRTTPVIMAATVGQGSILAACPDTDLMQFYTNVARGAHTPVNSSAGTHTSSNFEGSSLPHARSKLKQRICSVNLSFSHIKI